MSIQYEEETTAMPFVSLASDDVLMSTICSTRDGLAQWAMRERRRDGENFNLRGYISNSGNVIIVEV